jgi:hypothetical protein
VRRFILTLAVIAGAALLCVPANAGTMLLLGSGPTTAGGGGGGSSCTLAASLVADNEFTLNGITYRAQNASQTWSLRTFTGGTGCNEVFQFEVRTGDISNVDTDPDNVERSEVLGLTTWPLDTTIWCSWSERITTLHPTSLFVGSPQFHQSETTGNPPWAFNYATSGTFQINRRSGASPGGTVTLNTDYSNFPGPVRVEWHDWVIQVRFTGDDVTDTGIHQVWLDGTRIVNFANVPFGYSSSTNNYWKFGIYRGDAAEVSIKQYANVDCGTADLTARISNPELVPSVPIP